MTLCYAADINTIIHSLLQRCSFSVSSPYYSDSNKRNKRLNELGLQTVTVVF